MQTYIYVNLKKNPKKTELLFDNREDKSLFSKMTAQFEACLIYKLCNIFKLWDVLAVIFFPNLSTEISPETFIPLKYKNYKEDTQPRKL